MPRKITRKLINTLLQHSLFLKAVLVCFAVQGNTVLFYRCISQRNNKYFHTMKPVEFSQRELVGLAQRNLKLHIMITFPYISTPIGEHVLSTLIKNVLSFHPFQGSTQCKSFSFSILIVLRVDVCWDKIQRPYPEQNNMGHYKDVFETANTNRNINDF